MPGGNASLLDSNILLRLGKSDDPRQAAITHALRALVGQRYGSATPRRRLRSAARRISRLSNKTKMTSAFGHASMPDPPVPCKMEPYRPALPE